MQATFGITALVNNMQFYRQLRLVELKIANKVVGAPYSYEMTPEANVLPVSAYFVLASELIDIKPKALVGKPQVICPLIEGSVTGYRITNVQWYNDFVLNFLVYSYNMKPEESGIFQFQRLIGHDGASRWTNPEL